jgi:hypothetical protein
MGRQPHVYVQGAILLSASPHSMMATVNAGSPPSSNRPDATRCFCHRWLSATGGSGERSPRIGGRRKDLV